MSERDPGAVDGAIDAAVERRAAAMRARGIDAATRVRDAAALALATAQVEHRAAAEQHVDYRTPANAAAVARTRETMLVAESDLEVAESRHAAAVALRIAGEVRADLRALVEAERSAAALPDQAATLQARFHELFAPVVELLKEAEQVQAHAAQVTSQCHHLARKLAEPAVDVKVVRARDLASRALLDVLKAAQVPVYKWKDSIDPMRFKAMVDAMEARFPVNAQGGNTWVTPSGSRLLPE